MVDKTLEWCIRVSSKLQIYITNIDFVSERKKVKFTQLFFLTFGAFTKKMSSLATTIKIKKKKYSYKKKKRKIVYHYKINQPGSIYSSKNMNRNKNTQESMSYKRKKRSSLEL